MFKQILISLPNENLKADFSKSEEVGLIPSPPVRLRVSTAQDSVIKTRKISLPKTNSFCQILEQKTGVCIGSNANKKQIVNQLMQEGWTISRRNGGHRILEKEGMLRGVPIAVNTSKFKNNQNALKARCDTKIKTDYPYTIKSGEDGLLIVEFPDLADTFTQGKSLEEAKHNADEVLSAMLAYRLENHQEIPEPSSIKHNGLRAVPNPKVQAAILIRKARGEITLFELEDYLKISWSTSQMLENPYYWLTLKQLDEVAKALGKKLILTFE